jgi:hypothetical protein
MYLADDLRDALSNQRWITAVTFRPDASAPVPIAMSFEHVNVSLSTTEQSSLSPMFDDNVGDDVTLVYSAPLHVVANSSAPANGPRPFEYTVPLTAPFYYDPNAGNLLYDTYSSTGWSTPPVIDAEAGHPSSQIHTVAYSLGRMDPAIADATDSYVLAIQFTFAAAGDVNHDGQTNVVDVDELSAEIRSAGQQRRFDVNLDGSIDLADHDAWVHGEHGTWLGDADLDGLFNSTDLVEVLAIGTYETNALAGWSSGDWNADGLFDSGDLVVALADGGYEQGPRPAVAAVASVPEPVSGLLLALGMLGLSLGRRQTAKPGLASWR